MAAVQSAYVVVELQGTVSFVFDRKTWLNDFFKINKNTRLSALYDGPIWSKCCCTTFFSFFKLLSLLQPQCHTTSGKHRTTLFPEPPLINCLGMKGSTEEGKIQRERNCINHLTSHRGILEGRQIQKASPSRQHPYSPVSIGQNCACLREGSRESVRA